MNKLMNGLLALMLVGSFGVACGPTEDGGGEDGGGECNATIARPDGYATAYISVDDSAMKTYTDGQMKWKGSMAFDEATNIITHDGAWGGPFAPLYDDGPICDGGHEGPGSTAGDNIFGAAVYIALPAAGETVTIEYGMINELDTWIWNVEGGNGTFDVTDTSDEIMATGMTIPAGGTTDIKFTLDTANLHTDFATAWGNATADQKKIFVKGTMNGWASAECMDDGTKGDDTDADGIYTFVLSENLGPHDGKAEDGSTIEFVFELYSAGGTEYKSAGDAVADGVTAYSMPDGGAWGEETVTLVTGGLGGKNTAIVVGDSDE